MRLPLLLLLALLAGSTAPAQEPAPDRWTLPADESGLPGEGPLRRYPGYVKGWHDLRSAWAAETAARQHSVVFLGDSITQGWGPRLAEAFPEMKTTNRGISGDTTRGMLLRLADDVLALDPAGVVMLMGTNDL